MLAGVGGRTIAEAKNNLSLEEYRTFLAYREKYGTLAVQRRIEASKAVIASAIFNAQGGKTTPYDFTQWEKQPVYSGAEALRRLFGG